MVLTGGLKFTKKVLEFLGARLKAARGSSCDSVHYDTRSRRPSVIAMTLLAMFTEVK